MHTIAIEPITISITIIKPTISAISVTISSKDIGLRSTKSVSIHHTSPGYGRDPTHPGGNHRASDGLRGSPYHDTETGRQLAAVKLLVREELLVELVQLLGGAAVEVVPPVADEVQLAEEGAVGTEERVADVVAAHVEHLRGRRDTGQNVNGILKAAWKAPTPESLALLQSSIRFVLFKLF